MKSITIALMIATVCFVFNDISFAEESFDIASIYKQPLSTVDGKGMIDTIVKEAFLKIGVKVQIVPVDSKTALEKADKGLYDGDIMRVGDGVITQKYPNLVQVPETLYNFDFVAFSKNVNVPMSGWDGLKPYRVGIMTGWVILENNIRDENTKGVSKLNAAFDLLNTLIKGSTDLVIYERLMGYEIIKESSMSDIHVLEPPLISKQMFLYLHNKHKDLVPKLAAALSDMKKDGTIKKITDQALEKFRK